MFFDRLHESGRIIVIRFERFYNSLKQLEISFHGFISCTKYERILAVEFFSAENGEVDFRIGSLAE